MSLIAELYVEKIDYDLKHEFEHKMLFDEFFIFLMKDKFRVKSIVKKNSEESIASIIKYSIEDKRIDIARRFLGIGDNKLRIELLEDYLVLMKSNEINLFLFLI